MKQKESTVAVRAQAMEIRDAAGMERAAALLAEVTDAKRRVKEEREKVTRPLLDALAAERARWKPMEDELVRAETELRSRMSSYQTRMTAQAKEKEEKVVSRIGEGRGKLGFDTAIRKMAGIEKPARRVETERSGVTFRTVRKFEVTEVARLPEDCLLPNLVRIRLLMEKEGKEVDGVRYWDEEQVISRLRK